MMFEIPTLMTIGREPHWFSLDVYSFTHKVPDEIHLLVSQFTGQHKSVFSLLMNIFSDNSSHTLGIWKCSEFSLTMWIVFEKKKSVKGDFPKSWIPEQYLRKIPLNQFYLVCIWIWVLSENKQGGKQCCFQWHPLVIWCHYVTFYFISCFVSWYLAILNPCSTC